MRVATAFSAAACLLLMTSAPVPAAQTIGLVADPDPARQQELLRGAEAALTGRTGEPRLVVGQPASHWGGVTAEIEELIVAEGADVLVAPTDSRTAHLVAQIATRRHLPAIATSAGGPLATTGSWWFVTCEWGDRDEPRLAQLLGRPPSEWETAGFSAARVARTLLETSSGSWSSPGSDWRDRLPASCQEGEASDDQYDD